MTLAVADERGVSIIVGERGKDGRVRMTGVERVVPWDQVLQVALLEVERFDRFWWENRGFWQLTFSDRASGEISMRSARRAHLLTHLARLPGFSRERAQRMLRAHDDALVWQRAEVPCAHCGHRLLTPVPEAAPRFWHAVFRCASCATMSTLGGQSAWGLGDDRVVRISAEGVECEAPPARRIPWSSVVLVTVTHIPSDERPFFADPGHYKLFAADGARAHVPLGLAKRLRLLDALTVLPGFDRAEAEKALAPRNARRTGGAPVTLWQRVEVTCVVCGEAQLEAESQTGPRRWQRLLSCPRCHARLALGSSSKAPLDGE